MSKLGRVQPAEWASNISEKSTTPSKLSFGEKTTKNQSGPGVRVGVPFKAHLVSKGSSLTRATNQKNAVVDRSNVKNRILDAIYFVCPDCTIVQCSAIISGLLLVAILTLLLLYFGNYWDTIPKEDKPASLPNHQKNLL